MAPCRWASSKSRIQLAGDLCRGPLLLDGVCTVVLSASPRALILPQIKSPALPVQELSGVLSKRVFHELRTTTLLPHHASNQAKANTSLYVPNLSGVSSSARLPSTVSIAGMCPPQRTHSGNSRLGHAKSLLRKGCILPAICGTSCGGLASLSLLRCRTRHSVP